mmetsp:Transcript_25480/g.60650  ORF Transcript_25480/g.60650 Transcript_25480/m.60650 type:complete len:323 (-) Transcript_25480:1969-2937(-)
MSHDSTLRSFNDAIVNIVRTLSRDTTLEYVSEAGVSVVCPPATNRDLHVPSILTSNIMWHLISWYPISGATLFLACSGVIPSIGSNTSMLSILHISFSMDDFHFRQYFGTAFLTILWRSHSHFGAHHLKTGSSSRSLLYAYSASSTGLLYLRSAMGTQIVASLFSSTSSCKPLVVMAGRSSPSGPVTVAFSSPILIAVSSNLWLIISRMTVNSFPSASHCCQRFSAIAFALNVCSVPSGIRTSYSVSSIAGLSAFGPPVSPVIGSDLRLTTVPSLSAGMSLVPRYMLFSGSWFKMTFAFRYGSRIDWASMSSAFFAGSMPSP